MADVITREGKGGRAQVDSKADLISGLQEGKLSLPRGQAVSFRTKDGRFFRLDPEHENFATTLMDPSFELATGAELEERAREKQYGDRPFAAAGIAAADELTFGGSTALAAEIGGDETRTDMREILGRNEAAATAARLGTGIVTAIGTGGAGALKGAAGIARAGSLARRASLPTRVLKASPLGLSMRAAEAAEGAAARALSPLARQGLMGQVAQKAVSVGTAGAIEGAAMGAGRVVSEAALGDHEITGESLAAGIGMDALLGLGAGAALGTGGVLISGAARRATEGVKNMATGVKNMWRNTHGTDLPEGVAEVVASAASRGERQPIDVARAAMSDLGPEGRKAREILSRGREQFEEISGGLRGQLDEVYGAVDAADDFAKGSLKRAAVVKRVREDTGDAIRDGSDNFFSSLESLANEIDAKPASFGTAARAFKPINKILEEFRPAVDEALTRGGKEGAADAFIALDNAKRRFGMLAKNTTGDSFVHGEFDSVYNVGKEFLEHEGAWGEAGKIQRLVNAEWSPLISNGRVFNRMFRTESGLQDGFRSLYTSDPGKIKHFLERAGTAEGAIPDEIFNRQLDIQERMMEVLKNNYDLTPDVLARVNAAQKSAKNLRKAASDAQFRAKVLNSYHAIAGESNELLEGAASTAVGAAGGLLGGTFGAAALGAVAGQKAAQFAFRPKTRVQVLSAIDRLANGKAQKVVDGISRYVKGAVGEVAPRARRAALVTSVESTRERFDLTVKRLNEYKASPQALIGQLAPTMAQYDQVSPKVASAAIHAATRGAAFLQSKVPPGALPKDSIVPSSREPEVSRVEMAKFNRYQEAVEDPENVIRQAEDGGLMREHVEAFQHVYPRLYQRVLARAIEELSGTKKHVPYQKRIQLSILFDANLDPTMAPAFIGAMQNVFGQMRQAAAASGGGGAPGVKATSLELSVNEQTKSERVTQGG